LSHSNCISLQSSTEPNFYNVWGQESFSFHSHLNYYYCIVLLLLARFNEDSCVSYLDYGFMGQWVIIFPVPVRASDNRSECDVSKRVRIGAVQYYKCIEGLTTWKKHME
jgi:hypothetical protein